MPRRTKVDPVTAKALCLDDSRAAVAEAVAAAEW